MVPDHFRNNLGNCLIALNLSERLNVDAFMLMQTMFVISGKPGIEAKLATALFNERTKLFYPPLRYEKEGDYPKGKDARCRAYAKDKASDDMLYGEWIDWPLVEAEGWSKKNGSKWQTMPGQMFVYRAAVFFIRQYEAGVLLGLETKEELEDMIIDVTPKPQRTLKVDTDTGEIKEGEDIYATQEPPDGPPQEGNDETWDCHVAGCGFTAKSERGLKKHNTQSHPVPEPAPEPETQDEDPPPFDPDLPEATSAEVHAAAALRTKPPSTQISEIVREFGNGAMRRYQELIGKRKFDDLTPLEQEQVLRDMELYVDERNA
jgi:hypothetical protein